MRVIKQLGTQIKKWLFELSNCKSLKCNIDAGLFSATWKLEGKTTDCSKNEGARTGNSKQILAILAQNQKN